MYGGTEYIIRSTNIKYNCKKHSLMDEALHVLEFKIKNRHKHIRRHKIIKNVKPNSIAISVLLY